MHVVTTTRRYKGKVYRAHLLRRSLREGKSVRNETVANLSHLPDHVIGLIRGALRGEAFAKVEERFDVVASPHHGHVQAVLAALGRLGFASLLHARRRPERDLVVAMVVARVLAPQSKLATTRWWGTTTIPTTLGVADATEDDLYAAMDWHLARQPAIEAKLAYRHLEEGGLVLYDLASSYFEGTTCPVAKLGHHRDGRRGKLQVNYGVVADRRGCPVSVTVFEGNTSDPTTLLPELRKLRARLGVERMMVVGDRGMVAKKQIDVLREGGTVGWVTAETALDGVYMIRTSAWRERLPDAESVRAPLGRSDPQGVGADTVRRQPRARIPDAAGGARHDAPQRLPPQGGFRRTHFRTRDHAKRQAATRARPSRVDLRLVTIRAGNRAAGPCGTGSQRLGEHRTSA